MFHSELKTYPDMQILMLEFAHYDFKKTGTISAHDFALSMIAAADMDMLNEYLERANTLLMNPEYKEMRINPEVTWLHIPIALVFVAYPSLFGAVRSFLSL